MIQLILFLLIVIVKQKEFYFDLEPKQQFCFKISFIEPETYNFFFDVLTNDKFKLNVNIKWKDGVQKAESFEGNTLKIEGETLQESQAIICLNNNQKEQIQVRYEQQEVLDENFLLSYEDIKNKKQLIEEMQNRSKKLNSIIKKQLNTNENRHAQLKQIGYSYLMTSVLVGSLSCISSILFYLLSKKFLKKKKII